MSASKPGMSAVDNRRVEHRSSFSPGVSPAAKLACWGFITNGHSYERLPGGTRVPEKPLPSKVMVAERFEPFIRVSEDVFTELNLGPSLGPSLPVGA